MSQTPTPTGTAPVGRKSPYNGDEIAIIGMALRVPGANTPEQFWQRLADGDACFSPLSDEALLANGVSAHQLNDPRLVKLDTAMADIEQFDPRFFGLSSFDATLMDPQYRHFLELAWEALESAGQVPNTFNGTIGVYAGSGQNTYLLHHLMRDAHLVREPGHWYLRHVGNDKDFMTTRASFHLDLKGPSVNIQTACSTSLVAIHMAAQALLSRECDMALAGGITIICPPRQGYLAQEGGIEDPRGECRSFDASSKGTVFSSGGGVVTLRCLDDAIAAGDHIYGIIKASALSNDGADKAGYTAPSVDGQVAAISEALDLGEIDASTIGYMEGHGTGTPIGDPIEVEALTKAFRATTERKQYAALSSVKSNMGHMDTASGVISVIKALGAVYQGLKYPTRHYNAPNPALHIESSPFYVSAELERWQSNSVRRAGVSSMGVGGTNCFLVLEQGPARAVQPAADLGPYYLPLSAKSAKSLHDARHTLATYLEQSPVGLNDCIKTLLVGRQQFSQRAVIYGEDRQAVIDALRGSPSRCHVTGAQLNDVPKDIVFAFTGQGTQYFNMGKDLYQHNSVYREHFDRCAQLLLPVFGQDIRTLVFNDTPSDEQQSELDRIDVTHPILFSIAYALAQAWIGQGIKPTAMIGHSLGEYVAATIAGVFELEQVLRLVCERGRLMQSTPTGVMISVAADENELIPILAQAAYAGKLSIAGVNVAGMSVVAGEPVAGHALIDELAQGGVESKLLRIPRASHSVLMDSILDEYEACVARCRLKPAQQRYISTMTGQWLEASAPTEPRYWREHLRQGVRFNDGVARLMSDLNNAIFIEIGPGSQLARLLEQHPSKGLRHGVMTSMPGPKDAVDANSWFNLARARLWTFGLEFAKSEPRWQSLMLDQRPRVPLPTYAWDHQRCWIELSQAQEQANTDRLERLRFEQWFQIPSWQRQLLQPEPLDSSLSEQGTVLVLCDRLSPSLGQLLDCFTTHGITPILIWRGDTDEVLLESASQLVYSIAALSESSVDWLLTDLQARFSDLAQTLRLIVDWIEPCQDADQSISQATARVQAGQRQYFLQRFYWCKGLSSVEWQQLAYVVLGQGLLENQLGELDDPSKWLVFGPIRALSAEQKSIQPRFIDIDELTLARHSSALLQELGCDLTKSGPTWDEVLYRAGERSVRSFDSQQSKLSALSATSLHRAERIRADGLYLIVGLGDLALVTAAYLASTGTVRLVFLTRRALPPQEQWADIANSARLDQSAQRIRALLALQGQVASLRLVSADVTNGLATAQALAQIQQREGAINGVFYTAGVLNDQLLALKTAEQALAVLAPKVAALQAFESLLAQSTFDFFLAFSSTSALLAVTGQADYTAANSYLAGWARYQQARGYPVSAVHWGAWGEVGMAVQQARAQGLEAQVQAFAVAPFEYCHIVPRGQHSEYQALGHVDAKQWLFADHRTIAGQTIMPGSGYIDIMAKTYLNLTGAVGLELNDLVFMAPFALPTNSAGLIALAADLQDPELGQLSVNSSASLAQCYRHDMTEHVNAKVTPLSLAQIEQVQSLDIPALIERLGSMQRYEQTTHPFMQFGPRWQCLQRSWHLGQEAVLELALPEQFHADLRDYRFHPGLLDVAIGGQFLFFDVTEQFYVPFSYDRISCYHQLTPAIMSYVRYRAGNQDNDFAVFDVTITDPKGRVLLDIEGFHLKAVAAQGLDVPPIPVAEVEALDGSNPSINSQRGSGEVRDALDLFAVLLAQGIRVVEGQHALQQILDWAQLPAQIVVSSLSLTALRAVGTETDQQASTEQDQHLIERPVLSVPFEAPATELEQTIAQLWQQALGVRELGRHDHFFELGGHSLLLIQIIGRLKQRIEVSLPMSMLFNLSTIEQWASQIQAQLPQALTTVATEIDDQGNSTNTAAGEGSFVPAFGAQGHSFPQVVAVDRSKYTATNRSAPSIPLI